MRESWLHFVAFHGWYLFFSHWVKAHHVELLSGALFAFCKLLVCLLFHRHSYLDQTFNSAVTLVSSNDLPAFVLLSIPFFFAQSVGVKWVASFFYFGLFLSELGKCFIGLVINNEDKAGLCGGRNAFLTHVNEWSPHIPQQQALRWMAALTRLFSLLITGLCLLTMDTVIYLHRLRGGSLQSLCHRCVFFFSFNKGNLSGWDMETSPLSNFFFDLNFFKAQITHSHLNNSHLWVRCSSRSVQTVGTQFPEIYGYS